MANRLPPFIHVGLSTFLALDPARAKKIGHIVLNASVKSGIKEVASAISSASGLTFDKSNKVLNGLLYVYRSRDEEDAQQILEDNELVCEDVRQQQWLLEHVFDKLETSAWVRQLSKGIDIELEHERLFRGARIFTDVRPVFMDKPADGLNLAAVVHMFQIQFDDGPSEGVRAQYFALNALDLERLKKVVDRAIEKDKVARTLLRKMKIRALGQVDNG